MKWTPADVIRAETLRASGMTWTECAKKLGEQAGEEITVDSIKAAVAKYGDGGSDQDILRGAIKNQFKSQQSTANMRKTVKAVGQYESWKDEVLAGISEAVVRINRVKPPLVEPRVDKTKKDMTFELLISDIQYGQSNKQSSCEVFRARLREVTRATIQKIERAQQNFTVERIVVALLGDIIENNTLHGVDSAIGCDTTTADQVKIAIESLYFDLMLPLAKLGIPIDVPCVAGNHDRISEIMPTSVPGKQCITWPIYHALKLLLEVQGFTHIKFDITEEVFTHLDIYGHTVVYEHGYKLKPDETNMRHRRQARADQIGKPVTYFRMGDQHRCLRFGHDELIVNPAICGNNDYSTGLGFKAMSGQLLLSYIGHKDTRLPLYESFMIQLDHVNRESIK